MSEQVTKDVKAKVDGEQKVVGQVSFSVFENSSEAVSELGEEKVTALVNKAHAIQCMDTERRKHTGGGGTGVRAVMAALKDNPDELAKIMKKLGIEAPTAS